jgi:hypothetical protein
MYLIQCINVSMYLCVSNIYVSIYLGGEILCGYAGGIGPTTVEQVYIYLSIYLISLCIYLILYTSI